MQPKAFLLQECKNVKDLLDSTLQYEYGIEGSQDFFDECSTRLELIGDELSIADEVDAEALSDIGSRIINLADLICRIERSALGEHSWPFVAELRKVALACCVDSGVMSKPPLIHVISDGGLDGYAMNPEMAKPGYRNRRVLTIVLPRSARHHVLLHSILGHEIGHAMYRCSERQHDLDVDVLAVLRHGIFASEASLASHLYAATAPAEAQAFAAALHGRGITQANLFLWADAEAWIEEVLCDLVGLVTFGPSFVAATCDLLPALSPGGAEFGASHPPTGWRINTVLRCAEILGFNDLPSAEHACHEALKGFWTAMKALRRADPWYDVFSDAQLNQSITNIQALLAPLAPACCPTAAPEVIDRLLAQLQNGIPPTGYVLSAKGKPECQAIDFRHIIFAGWIACQTQPPEQFEKINLFCEHGVMQQAGINLTLKRKSKARKKPVGAK